MRVLAFEDHYDIQAMLAAGGVNTDALVIEQRWNSTDAVERIRGVRSRRVAARPLHATDERLSSARSAAALGRSATVHRHRHVERLGKERRHGEAGSRPGCGQV